jgi:hypothetical protein
LRVWFFAMLGAVAVAAAVSASSAEAVSPLIHATWAERVTASSALLQARIDAEGSPVSYRFDYIAEASYRANIEAGRDGFQGAERIPPGAEKGAGEGADAPVSQEPHDLVRETTYRYRIVARNADGSTSGQERTLTTKGLGGPLVLLDGRGWEMVSPVDKNGGEVQGAGGSSGGGVLQAASQGGAATFSSTSSFGVGGGGSAAASQYVARRGTDGWVVVNVTGPLSSGGYGDGPVGVPYQLFSSDISRGLLLAPDYPPFEGTDAPAMYRNYYRREADGEYAALLTYADVAGLAMPPQRFELGFSGASPDLEHVVLSTCAALSAGASEVPGAEGGCDPADPNLYEWSGSGLRLLNIPGAGFTGGPPARLAAPSGAISSDGTRVFWTDGADLYLSEVGAETVLIHENASFQAASRDGSAAFFTENEHLRRYDVGTGTTVDLTPAGGVTGVLGVSDTGAYVYFLTAAGLFVDHAGTIAEVAAAASPADFPPSTGTARVSADGTRLAFVSAAELTPYDNTDQKTGKPDDEVYLYDAVDGVLTCVSCNPTGERPGGPSGIPGAIANGQGEGATRAYRPRALTDDGKRLFFDSGDALVAGDSNENQDVYEWEEGGTGTCTRPSGCVQLISAGSSHGSSFVDASADGADAFFLTDNSLVKADPGSVDLYDARENGGFPEPPTQIVCEEDSCQPLPSPPDDPAPGTLVPTTGNPPVHFPKTHKAKSRHKKHGRHRHSRRGGRG